jgi:hypothetical protein
VAAARKLGFEQNGHSTCVIGFPNSELLLAHFAKGVLTTPLGAGTRPKASPHKSKIVERSTILKTVYVFAMC